jgi:hypothetical protein
LPALKFLRTAVQFPTGTGSLLVGARSTVGVALVVGTAVVVGAAVVVLGARVGAAVGDTVGALVGALVVVGACVDNSAGALVGSTLSACWNMAAQSKALAPFSDSASRADTGVLNVELCLEPLLCLFAAVGGGVDVFVGLPVDFGGAIVWPSHVSPGA